MRVFISWSGPVSRKVATFFYDWIRKLPLSIEPWISGEAIDPGTRWEKELSEALAETRFGILCITSENQGEPWICFEAGALSKTIEKTHVIPYLIDIKPNQLKHPLKQFQGIEATKDDTWKLIKIIYKASGDKSRSENDLKEAYEMWWQKLQENIESAKHGIDQKAVSAKEPDFEDLQNRLDTIITIVESLSARITKWESSGSPLISQKIIEYKEPQVESIKVVVELAEKEDISSNTIDYLEQVRRILKLENKTMGLDEARIILEAICNAGRFEPAPDITIKALKRIRDILK